MQLDHVDRNLLHVAKLFRTGASHRVSLGLLGGTPLRQPLLPAPLAEVDW